ncbi:MAG: M20 family metallopeptidase [Faecalibacterium sp.]|jgi:amidohydrolase|nr:M20 family metallopeptidase [Faecalibacterium sp.]
MEEKQRQQAEALAPRLAEIRRALHRCPEPARREEKTAALVARTLRALPGITVKEHVFATGILAELSGALPGPTVALRADMDALNLTEETGLPYASEVPGMMHACGHDFHITFLLGAAMLLAQRQSELHGTVRFIFQPSEEYSPEGGSRGMIAAGALKGASAVFGLHVWPDLPYGKIGIKPGPLMACSDHFYVHLHGKSAHAARPDEGIDALQAGCRYATAVQTIVSRSLSPLQSAAVSIGKIEAGSRYNIVAQECTLEGTARTLEPQARQAVEDGLRRILAGECTASGCTGELDYRKGYCPTVNDAAMTAYAEKTAARLLGGEAIVKISQPTMIAEDFGFYLKEVPGCFFWLGTQKPGTPFWPLHSSHFAPDEALLPYGAALLAALALDFGKENRT